MTLPTTNGVLPKGRKPKNLNIVWDGEIKNGPTTRSFDYFYGISASLDMAPYAWIKNDRILREIPDHGKAPDISRTNRPTDRFVKGVSGEEKKYSYLCR